MMGGKNETVSDKEWIAARLTLLEKEKQLNKLRDELSAERRSLPWREVTTNYSFDGPDNSQTLNELFADKSQLIIYHFMYGADWQEGCKSCSFWADQYDTVNKHIGQRDVALAVISRAPWQAFTPFKQRMGWQFTWLSAANNTFNTDYHVSFDSPGDGDYNYRKTGVREEMPGLSVFCKDEEGKIFHTYSCYARGLDPLNATYQMLDLVPKGRDESDLPFPMAWLNFSDSY
jgi:predicted dithiol-disulfide oxidoreductase (DUF899 family)